MAKKTKAEQFKYLDVHVGIYKKSAKGFYRDGSMPLRDVLTREAWDKTVEIYRASKTAELPKGNSDLKKNIRAYQPSGDYRDKPRSTKNKLATATRLVQLDFDFKDKIVSTKKIQQLFAKYKFVAVAARSCGAQGFYLLVHVETSEDYEEYFAALCAFFKKEESMVVDEAVGSINELRFVSLTSEVLIRENAEVWTTRAKVVKSTMDRVVVPMDGKLIALPEVLNDKTGAHYADITSWAGKQNVNGVPLAVALEGFPFDRISKSSSFYRKDKAVKEVIEHIYDSYSDQHGVAAVTDLMLTGDVELPELQFMKDDSLEKRAQMILDCLLMKYQFKTDYVTEMTYRFNGTHWEPVRDFELRNFLTSCALATRMDPSRSRLPGFRDIMLDDIKDRTRCDFVTPANAFNVNNGVILFENGEVNLLAHSDEYLFTYKLDYDYDQSCRTSKHLDRFLNDVLPDKATQQMFFDYVGAAFLDPHVKFEKTLFLLGTGSNGKSTLVQLIADTFGDAVGYFNHELLTDVKESSKEARNIYNKVFGVCTEGKMIKDFTLWKTIVSREKTDVKYLYKDTFKTSSYGRLITCMNEAPNIDAIKGAMRRALCIGMTAEIAEDKMDMRLNSKLREDRTYFVNRLIDGYKRVYTDNGYIVESEQSQELTRTVIDDGDQVFSFLKMKHYFPVGKPDSYESREQYFERLLKTNNIKGEVVYRSPTEIYKEFMEFCKEESISFQYGRKKFIARLREMSAKRLRVKLETKFETCAISGGTDKFAIGIFSDEIAVAAHHGQDVSEKKRKIKREKSPF